MKNGRTIEREREREGRNYWKESEELAREVENKEKEKERSYVVLSWGETFFLDFYTIFFIHTTVSFCSYSVPEGRGEDKK